MPCIASNTVWQLLGMVFLTFYQYHFFKTKRTIMRPLIYLAILLMFPLAFRLFSSESPLNAEPITDTAKLDDTKYCNSRFDFCVIYPGDLLPTKVVSDNDDFADYVRQDRGGANARRRGRIADVINR